MKLLVVIPTWNRADYLDKAISAISTARARARSCEVELFISDNQSSDRTPEVVARWQEAAPWIHCRRWEEHTTRWSEILRRAFLGSDLEADYLWLQGDDDWIVDSLAYEKLARALEAHADAPPALVHCCQARRSYPKDGRVVEGVTEDLCNLYGWHDLLGWISSLVISKDTVVRMMSSPQLDMAHPSVFCHSEALLEAAYGQRMLILAAGLIDPQDEEQTAECIERWRQARVPEQYWLIVPGLLNLRQRGILAKDLAPTFFRYQVYSFWDRFAGEIMTLTTALDVPDEVLEDKLGLLGLLGSLLSPGPERKLYETWLEGLRNDARAVRSALRVLGTRIAGAANASHPWELMPPPQSGRTACP